MFVWVSWSCLWVVYHHELFRGTHPFALLEQAIGRVHRLGQSRAVRAVRFFTRATVEESMHDEMYQPGGASEEKPKAALMEALFQRR